MSCFIFFFFFFFFFQAEDGIRDVAVTGVQTCALPISQHRYVAHSNYYVASGRRTVLDHSEWTDPRDFAVSSRSEPSSSAAAAKACVWTPRRVRSVPTQQL